MGENSKIGGQDQQTNGNVPKKPCTPAAHRALKEAEARRAAADRRGDGRAIEVNGRGGKDPVRYGDWEVKGLASDF